MKVAFVLNSISGGGIARVVTNYANRLSNEGIEVELILMHRKNHLYAVHKDIQIIENPVLRDNSSKLKYTINSVKFLRSTIRKGKYSRIVVNGEWLNAFVFLALIGIKTGELYFFDHSNPNRPNQSPMKLADKFTYNRVDGVLVLSQDAKQKVVNTFKVKNVSVLDNPIEFKDKSELNDSKDIVICMGRLSEEKGQDVLIRAFSKLETSWKLHFLGDGDFKDDLIQLSKELGIEQKVEFLGNQQNIQHFLSRAKIYVMPSHTENFPMALLESMSLGLPVVATNCMPWRGNEDFITHGENGLKVKVNDPDEMAQAIGQLIESKDKRDFFAAKSLEIRDRFNILHSVKKFKEAINL